MTRSLGTDRDGATAVEFALIAPVLLLIVGAVLGLGLAFWTRSALQQAATETARCVAIGSPDCSRATSGCASASPGVCYLQTMATRRGAPPLLPGQIAIDRNGTVGGTSFTIVTVTYPASYFGYDLVLQAIGHFPNPDPR